MGTWDKRPPWQRCAHIHFHTDLPTRTAQGNVDRHTSEDMGLIQDPAPQRQDSLEHPTQTSTCPLLIEKVFPEV